MRKLKYTTLLEYVVRILAMVRTENPGSYISLSSLFNAINYPLSFSEIQGIGKYLEMRGWVKAIFSLGTVRAQITAAGLIYTKEKDEEFNNEFDLFLESIKKVKRKPLLVRIFKDEEDPKKIINELLGRVSKKISAEEEFAGDHSKDIEIIKVELSKTNPDFRMIETKLSNLANINHINRDIQELKDYLVPEG
jgi:hypothetical protein